MVRFVEIVEARVAIFMNETCTFSKRFDTANRLADLSFSCVFCHEQVVLYMARQDEKNYVNEVKT